MTEDKQIEEMAENITLYRTRQRTTRWGDVVGESRTYSSEYEIAQDLYEAGYRKASEVAEDIVRMLRAAGINEWRYPIVANIKKKYLESEKDDG